MLYFSCGRPYNQIEAGDGTLDRSDGTTHSLNRAGNSLSIKNSSSFKI